MMDMRKQVVQIETQLKQIDEQAAKLAAGRLRAEGALMLARAYVAEEDALPKLQDVGSFPSPTPSGKLAKKAPCRTRRPAKS
jgi:hypothetical protein